MKKFGKHFQTTYRGCIFPTTKTTKERIKAKNLILEKKINIFKKLKKCNCYFFFLTIINIDNYYLFDNY